MREASLQVIPTESPSKEYHAALKLVTEQRRPKMQTGSGGPRRKEIVHEEWKRKGIAMADKRHANEKQAKRTKANSSANSTTAVEEAWEEL